MVFFIYYLTKPIFDLIYFPKILFSEFLFKVTEMLERIRERNDEEKTKKISIKSSSAMLLESMCLIFGMHFNMFIRIRRE